MHEIRQKLLRLLRDKFYHFNKNLFTLSSGQKSSYYIDGKATLHDPEGKALVGELILELIKDLNIDAIGGLTMGADPLPLGIDHCICKDAAGINGHQRPGYFRHRLFTSS
jgi:orotate phosphoribosyltransferase